MSSAAAQTIDYLDGPRLSRGLRAGIARLLADRENLNRINVFPVPDGDTGTNLGMTMQAVLEELRRGPDRHVGRLLTRIADAALDGARGNSGAILAQFLQGLADAAGESSRLSPDAFAAAVANGARYARDAISEPREGTLLTVLDDFAAALGAERHRLDFSGLFRRGLQRAHRSLADTPLKLEALRRAGVVDAGAQGFVDLLQGIADYLVTGEIVELPADIEASEAPRNSPEIDARYRYCTECIVHGEQIDRRKLREALSELGGSLVIAGTTRKVRIHIHADDPQAVFDLAAGHGELRQCKADDMTAQQRSGARPVAIVTDSACDLPDEEFERLNIYLIPLRIHFGERSFLDRVSIDPAEFYAELARHSEPPKTSQPAPGDFRRHYEFLSSHQTGIVSIHVTARASGTYQAALAAAQRVADADVDVIDSGNASLGQGLIVRYAAECAERGLSTGEIGAAVRDMLPRTHTRALLGDLAVAVRGGRIPGWVEVIARWLRLTPILGNRRDGSVGLCGAFLGRRRRLEKFARHVLALALPGRRYRLGIGHARCPEEAGRLRELLEQALPTLESSLLTEVGTALGAHGGAGTLVAALQEYAPPPAGTDAAQAGR